MYYPTSHGIVFFIYDLNRQIIYHHYNIKNNNEQIKTSYINIINFNFKNCLVFLTIVKIFGLVV